MTELLTAAQMRAIEQAAIQSGAVTGLELMERAGRGVVEAIFEEWPELKATSHRAVVLCGPGNNGGDGFVVARLLKDWGWEVEVFLYGDPDKLPPDARVNRERWIDVYGAVLPIGTDDEMEKTSADWQSMESADLVVDALFGTGLSRPRPLLWAVSSLVHSLFDDQFRVDGTVGSPRLVAVDMPSGLCSDSGRSLEPAESNADRGRLAAHLTVSFHRRKLGQMLGEGPALCGKAVVADIGLVSGASASNHSELKPDELIEAPTGRLGKEAGTHKYTHGHALILSGPAGRGGAARLAARGALRIGAGLVTIAGPGSVEYQHCSQITAIMWREIKGAPGLRELLEDERINALCLGPGMGLGQATGHLVLAALEAGRPTVLDADALTQFERDPTVLFDALHEKAVLTPHPGEFARLFPDIAEKLDEPATQGPAYSKVDATRAAAARAGCTVLLKGPDTVIATREGRARINSAHYERSAPWLATAGSGDVLAGFITGLMARGFAPLEAASTAAWLHVETALKFGPGLIAEDLPETLPSVFRDLGL